MPDKKKYTYTKKSPDSANKSPVQQLIKNYESINNDKSSLNSSRGNKHFEEINIPKKEISLGKKIDYASLLKENMELTRSLDELSIETERCDKEMYGYKADERYGYSVCEDEDVKFDDEVVRKHRSHYKTKFVSGTKFGKENEKTDLENINLNNEQENNLKDANLKELGKKELNLNESKNAPNRKERTNKDIHVEKKSPENITNILPENNANILPENITNKIPENSTNNSYEKNDSDEKNNFNAQTNNSTIFNKIDPIKMVVKGNRIPIPNHRIINKKNNCFFNASIQVLLSLPSFTEFYMRLASKKFSGALNRFITNYLKSDPIDPVDFINAVKQSMRLFDGNEQDAHEFLVFFLQNLYYELGGSEKALKNQHELEEMDHSNFISRTFFGMLRNSCVCLSCGKKTENFEEFLMVSLFIGKSLGECIKEFFKSERIEDYACAHCQSKANGQKNQNRSVGVKNTTIEKFPPVLMIHLKRFSNRSKNTDKIHVEPILELFNVKYELMGCIIHHGNLNGGHYFSYAKRKESWYRFDDMNVVKEDFQESGNYRDFGDFGDGYIFFYTKKSF